MGLVTLRTYDDQPPQTHTHIKFPTDGGSNSSSLRYIVRAYVVLAQSRKTLCGVWNKPYTRWQSGL